MTTSVTVASRLDDVRRVLSSSAQLSAIVGGRARIDAAPGGTVEWRGGGLGTISGRVVAASEERLELEVGKLAVIDGFGLGPQLEKHRFDVALSPAPEGGTRVLLRGTCATAQQARVVAVMWERRLLRPLQQHLERLALLDDVGAVVELSPRAAFMWSSDEITVLSGAAGKHFKLARDAAAGVIASFSTKRRMGDVFGGLDPAAAPAFRDAAAALVGAEALVVEGSASHPQRWEPHDLLFHDISSLGGNAAWHRLGDDDCPPAVKPAMTTSSVALPHTPRIPDVALDAALAGRRSIREFAREPLSLETFSAFFSMTTRNATGEAATRWNHEWMPHEYVARPYPSGGARYSLEVYALVANGAVEGVAAGTYHYAPDRHELEALRPGADAFATILGTVTSESMTRPPPGTTRDDAVPPVLLVVTSRIDRVTFKYGGLAFKLVLQELGALWQTFHLAAAALRLGGCVLGVGPARELPRIAGVAPAEEPVIGAFMLGVPHPDARA